MSSQSQQLATHSARMFGTRMWWGLSALGVFSAACAYENGVFDALVKYSFISKLSYCIDMLVEDHNFTEPIVLKPKPMLFVQSGARQDDYFSFAHHEEVRLHIAKVLVREQGEVHPASIDSKFGTHQSSTSTSVGFFAVDHSNNGSIVVSLRGSINYRDYLTDLDTRTVEYKPLHPDAEHNFTQQECTDCKVHKGFYERYSTIQHEVVSTVETLMEYFPGYRLVVTGHSLGGSLSILAGIEFALMGYDPLILAYGNPKVSNLGLSDFMDTLFLTNDIEETIEQDKSLHKGCIRVVHRGDFVPLFPPGNNKFIQCGLEFYIDKDGLPQSKNDVYYRGKANRISHPVGFKLSDLVSLDLQTILHHKEHSDYFFDIGECEDVVAQTHS